VVLVVITLVVVIVAVTMFLVLQTDTIQWCSTVTFIRNTVCQLQYCAAYHN
jgi:hypothetical protein